MKKYLVIFSLALCLGAFAQDVNEELEVRLVELDVKVTDWSGRYISGLEAGEFTVMENGRAQAIDSFEEVDVQTMSDEERRREPTRIMVVLDLKNTSFSRMKRVFPQLKEYANTLFDNKVEMGLAVNGDGYGEVQTFTNDRDAFFAALEDAESYYQKSKYRILRPAARNQVAGTRPIVGAVPFDVDALGGGKPEAGPFVERALASEFNPDTVSLNRPSGNFLRINDASQDKYIWSELQAMRQFVNYMSAYSGKKSMVMLSSFWSKAVAEEDLRDIVTTCVLHKISINVLGLDGTRDISEDRFKLSADGEGLTHSSGLAGNTAGYQVNVNYRKVSEMMGRMVEDAGRYYRIRYYSEVNGKAFRKLKVKVAGPRRLVSTFSGYDARPRKVVPEVADARVLDSSLEEADLNLALDTEWLDWEWTHVRKQRAFYAVGQQAFDAEGRLLGEKVDAGQIIRRKTNGAYENVRLEKEYALNLPPGAKVARLNFVVVDLNTGKKMTVQHEMPETPQI